VTTVAALFVREDSIYKRMAGVDPWDASRDACQWPGSAPLVAHPPCRAWGRFRQFAKPRPDEKFLAVWALWQIQVWGGVLEHPAHSALWKETGLPKPGEPADLWGGYTIEVCQHRWGHKAEKKTWLYICGASRDDLPPMPHRPGKPEYVVRPKQNGTGAKFLTKAEREHSPPEFAAWLVSIARRCAWMVMA
jgi:hypothetical protein